MIEALSTAVLTSLSDFLAAQMGLHFPSNRSLELGVLADVVLGLKSVPMSEIQPSLPTLRGIREDFLRGVTRESMVLLDAKQLLSARQTGWQASV